MARIADRSISFLGLLAACCALPGCARQTELETVTGLAQGTTYTVQWWREPKADAAAVAAALAAELERIDALLSNYRSDSVIERFNAARHVEIAPLPEELVALLGIAADVHRASAGCFDPSVRPLSRVWGFDGAEPRVPAPAAITAALENVGFDKLEVIDASHVRKAVPALEIDLASIGQGYTVGRLAAILEQLGIADYLVEIGGELMARGQKPGGEPWRIGIEEAGPGHAATVSALALPPDRPTAAVTSGTYRRYFEEGGRAYSHILDPRTGRPVDHALSAVTVLHSDPTLAGAWATALLCLGPERAAAVAERERLAAVLSVETGASLEQRTTTAFRERWDLASRQPRRLPR